MRMRCEENNVGLHDKTQMKGPWIGSIMNVWS